MAKKSVTIHYRRLNLGHRQRFNGASLEAAIRQAMETKEGEYRIADRYRHRVWQRGEEDADNLFINHYHSGAALVFGDVIHFSKGHMQAVFDATDDEAEVDVQQLELDERQEYIHSLMYWMVKDNHVFIIQSQSLKTNALEGYLGWLLKNRTNIINDAGPVVLDSKFDPGAVGGNLDDIREVVIGGTAAAVRATAPDALAGPVEIREVENPHETNVEAGRAHEKGVVRKVLEAVLGSPELVDQTLRSVPENVELGVKVHLAYRSNRRKIERIGLKHLETSMRNLDDADISVVAGDGNRSADGKIRLHHNVGISVQGSLLDVHDVLRAMQEAYDVMVANGKIEV